MIVSGMPRWGRVARYLGLPLLSLFVWDFLIVVAYKLLGWTWVGSDHIPLALYGSAIGIVVGFRNNSAYSRWWEARGLWGQIVNQSRNLARQIYTTLQTDTEKSDMARRIVYLQIAFVHALRQQLRGLDALAEIRPLVTAEELAELSTRKNLALALHLEIGMLVRGAQTKGWIDSFQSQSLDRTLSDLMTAQGGTERIKNTPMPKLYDFFVMLFVNVYCMLLPVGMVEGLGWFTPLGSTFVGLMFLALDRIGRSLEDPFDNEVYDVPLLAITTTIEINLREMLGEKDLPKAQAPVDGILW